MKVEDYLKNIKDSNVSYYLYVRENLKPNDYVKLNTGEITRSMNVSPIKGNKIYYANGDDCWFDVSAVKNFSPNIIDLIKEHDLLRLYDVEYGEEYITEVVIDSVDMLSVSNYDCDNFLHLVQELMTNEHIKLISIVTSEQFSQMEYRIGE